MRALKIGIFILVLSGILIGQTNRGGMTGTVKDTAGDVVPNAKVTITNQATTQSIVLNTSDSGVFIANLLEPVLYRVEVEVPNFKRALVENVKVDTASVASLNIIIEAGNVSEEVTIQADAQMVNADSGTLSQTITERQLRDLPLFNRSVLDLAVTMPNVSGDSGSEDVDATSDQPVPGFNLSVNGGRPGSTSMLADGVNNTGVGIARAVVSFSPETVQEFSVQSSAYSAEFGTTGGGVINITTKSGANNFFGTALWYHRNPVTNAAPWRQGTAPRPNLNLRSNQVSVTAGGPIFLPTFGDDGKWYYNGRNKSFWFFAYEPRWRNDFVSSNGLLPTLQERSGNFRDLVFTSSGWLPKSIADQFGQSYLVGPAEAAIYQRYTVGAGGILTPIAVPVPPTGSTYQFCPFGSVDTIGGVGGQISYNGAGQPYCTAQQATAQIANAANNPALNVIPTQFLDPAGVRLMGIMDNPGNYFLDNGLVRNYQLNRSVIQNETRYTLRLDHNFTDNFKANFRYSKTPAVGIRGAGGEINGNTGVYSDAQQYLVTFNNTFSSTITNDLRLNYTRGNFSEDFSPEYAILTGKSFSTELGLTSLTQGGMPLFWLNQDGQYSNADLGAGGSTNNFNVENRYSLSDTLYLTRGNMVWKIGGEISRATLEVVPFFAASGGRWQFRRLQTNRSRTGGNGNADGGNGLASMLIGVPNAQDFRPALFEYNYQWDSYSMFVQNDWKVTANFTLNLGARYALQMPRKENNNLQGVFRPDLAIDQTLTEAQRRAIATAAGVLAANPIPSYIPTIAKIVPFAFSGSGGRSEHIVPVDYSGIEPRIGFAWSPGFKPFGWDLASKGFVIRGGYGVSHFPINGNNRSANPDFGGFTTASTNNNITAANPVGSTGAVNPSLPVRLTGNNALQGSSVPLNTLLGTDSNGLVFAKSLAIPGVAVDFNDPDLGKVPYSQNWNLAVQFGLFRNSTLEIAYTGNRGVHLYTPQINISARDTSVIETLTANNINPAGNAPDPLGRRTLLNAAINVPVASLFSTYMGFDPLNKFFNAKSRSIRHAGYVDFRRRMSSGLSLTANYTFARSWDDSSDSSPDVRVLSTGSVRGQTSLGGSLEDDWALSAFDVTHTFTSTFTYDLPVGKGRAFLRDAPWYVNGPLGGWTINGIFRLVGGNPYQPFITDANSLGGTLFNRVVRPDIVPGVSLKNPLWDASCRTGSSGGANGGGCEPYLNPAAFKRPAKGELGNAPRSLSIRGPFREYFDFSIQKNFPMPWISGEGKRKINFRIDLLNAFNHPVFAWNNLGNTPSGMGTAPVEITAENATIGGVTFAQPITAAEYNTWAAFNNRPLTGTSAGDALLLQIRQMVNGVRLPPRPGTTSGALPDNFFSTNLPQGFATSNALGYDITTLNGFKLYRLRQNYDGNFGTLGVRATDRPRYLQFGIRFIF